MNLLCSQTGNSHHGGHRIMCKHLFADDAMDLEAWHETSPEHVLQHMNMNSLVFSRPASQHDEADGGLGNMRQHTSPHEDLLQDQVLPRTSQLQWKLLAEQRSIYTLENSLNPQTTEKAHVCTCLSRNTYVHKICICTYIICTYTCIHLYTQYARIHIHTYIHIHIHIYIYSLGLCLQSL